MSCLSECPLPCPQRKRGLEESTSTLQDKDDHPLTNPVGENIPLLMCESSVSQCGVTSDPAHYQLMTALGQGWDGAVVVSLAKHVVSASLVAIKRTNLEKCEHNIDEVQHEVVVTRQLNHENIIPYLATFVNNREIWSIMPHMGYGCARDILATHFALGMSELLVAFLLRDVLQALEYIHSKGFVHRSIRASHFLVASSGRVCLSGLRYSCSMVENGRWQRAIYHFPANTAHNLNWLSPEVLQQNLQGYNTSSDVYSVGIAACEMANGIVPFADMVPSQMLLEKLRGATPCLIDANTSFEGVENGDAHQSIAHDANNGVKPDPTPTLPGSQYRVFTESFHQFIQLCLHFEPTMRPTSSQLLSHSFIKQCRKASISITELLLPATPIVDMTQVAEDSAMAATEQQLDNMSVEEMWTF